MHEGVDTVVLYNELASEDLLPVAWKPLSVPLDPGIAAAFQDRNLRLLQACAAIEEHAGIDKPDDTSPNAAALARMDLKITLILDLVGQLVAASQQRPATVAIRFNAHGAEWKASRGLPAVGTQGVLDLYVHDSLPQPLSLPAEVIGSTAVDGQVKVKFISPGEPVANLIEKLAFRRHRRRVAGARQPPRRT
jgi:hypothetical protein